MDPTVSYHRGAARLGCRGRVSSEGETGGMVMVVGNVWWHIKATCVGRRMRLMKRQDGFGRQCRRRHRHRNRLPRHPVRRGLPML